MIFYFYFIFSLLRSQGDNIFSSIQCRCRCRCRRSFFIIYFYIFFFIGFFFISNPSRSCCGPTLVRFFYYYYLVFHFGIQLPTVINLFFTIHNFIIIWYIFFIYLIYLINTITRDNNFNNKMNKKNEIFFDKKNVLFLYSGYFYPVVISCVDVEFFFGKKHKYWSGMYPPGKWTLYRIY